MTTLAGIQGKGWCVLGADSQISSGNRRIMGGTKVIEQHGLLIATCGEVRGMNLIRYNMAPPSPSSDGEQFIVTELIPTMRKDFIENGYLIPEMQQTTSDTISIGGDIESIVAFQGELYEIASDFAVTKDPRGIFSNGSGGDIALGVLASHWKPGGTKTQAKALVKKAIETAAQYDIYTQVPVLTYSQDKE